MISNQPVRPHPNGSATIKDVAAAAQVSTATVSRVLSGSKRARPQLRQRVLAAVKTLKYHPNHLARDLRAGLRRVIGVIIPDLQNPFLTGVVRGVEDVLQRSGYSLILGNSDEQAEREQRHLAVLRGEGAAGLILVPSDAPHANYEALRNWDIPIVAADRMPRGLQVDLVCSNNREGAREATRHLIAHGYRDIAIIGGPDGVNVADDRLAGYREALVAAGITPRHSLIMHSNFRQAGGRASMLRLLDLARPPRAVFVANNLMTLGALQAIHERGMRIPEEMAVVGFDDMPWAISLRPPLTVVAQPIEEIGRVAAQLMLERLKDPGQMARQVVLSTQLIVRASCGAHPFAPPPVSKNSGRGEINERQAQPGVSTK
jgi:LacI family transcriptional regulator